MTGDNDVTGLGEGIFRVWLVRVSGTERRAAPVDFVWYEINFRETCAETVNESNFRKKKAPT